MSQNEHATRVAAWLERNTQGGRSAAQLVDSFEHALGALWARAHRTLGDVTLTAILGRVLHDASEKYPDLPALAVVETGGDVRELRARAHALSVAEVSEVIRFVLTEFLNVLGNLTAEIMTPALHAELSSDEPRGEPPAENKRALERRQIGGESRHDKKD